MSLPTIEIGLPGWTLRAWRAADAEALARYADNLRIWRHMSDAFPHPYPIELAQHWVTHGHVDFGGDNWAIALHDEAAGGGGLHPGAGAARCSCEIGYWLGEPFWGHGVGTQVVRVLSGLAFARPEVTRVFATVHADNPASMRVLEKNGFVREGVLRRSVLKAGTPIDIVNYAKIRD